MNYFSKGKKEVLEEPPIVIGLSKQERFAILGIVALNLPFNDLSYPNGRSPSMKKYVFELQVKL